MEEEKVCKYQISFGDHPKDIAIDWNKLSKEMLNDISGDYYVNSYAYSESSGRIISKSVLYFRKVTKFSGNMKEHKVDNIIFGV